MDKYSTNWILESYTRKCIAVISLPHYSKWFKENNSDWGAIWAQDVAETITLTNLITSAPIMLKALLAVKNGDTSLVDEAIDHASGEAKWFDRPQVVFPS